MLEQEFDRFAQEYEQLHASVLTASGEGPAFSQPINRADMRRHLAAAGVSRGPLTLLDFGCGVGGSLPHLRREFPDAELIGADVSRKSLDIAERRYPGLARFIGLNETGAMPLPEASADVVFSACVFRSYSGGGASPHPLRSSSRDEARRLLVYLRAQSFEPPHAPRRGCLCLRRERGAHRRNGAQKAHPGGRVSGCEDLLSHLLPHALKWLRRLENALAWCPLGAQYYVAARRAA